MSEEGGRRTPRRIDPALFGIAGGVAVAALIAVPLLVLGAPFGHGSPATGSATSGAAAQAATGAAPGPEDGGSASVSSTTSIIVTTISRSYSCTVNGRSFSANVTFEDSSGNAVVFSESSDSTVSLSAPGHGSVTPSLTIRAGTADSATQFTFTKQGSPPQTTTISCQGFTLTLTLT